MRDIKRIKRICRLLEKAWTNSPDQRFAQFLINNSFAADVFNFWNLEDDLVEMELEQICKEINKKQNDKF